MGQDSSVSLERTDGRYAAPSRSIASWPLGKRRLLLAAAGLAWLAGIGFLAAMTVMRFQGAAL